MSALLPYLPWFAAGVGAMGVFAVLLFPYRRSIVAWGAGLVRDPTSPAGDGSSKRTAAVALILTGCIAVLLDHAASAGVAIAGGLAALGISTNADGTSALSSGIAAVRGILPAAPEKKEE